MSDVIHTRRTDRASAPSVPWPASARLPEVATVPSPHARATPLVSVIVPAYNEEVNLGQNLEVLCVHLTSCSDRFRWEVIVVDDGSTDRTAGIAERVARRWPSMVVVHHTTNLRLGQALRTGFLRARGDYVVTLDSDLTYSPSHVDRMFDAIRASGAAVVIASPYARDGCTTAIPRPRLLLSRAANRMLAISAGGDLTTLTGMVRMYDRTFLSTLDLRASDISINTEILYKARLLNARIEEIPAHLDWTGQAESGRRSKMRILSGVAAYLWAGFLFRPGTHLALPGALLLTVGAVWMLVAGSGERIAVIGPIVALVVAMQMLTTGLLAAQNRSYFDDQFHLATATSRRVDEHADPSRRTPGSHTPVRPEEGMPQ